RRPSYHHRWKAAACHHATVDVWTSRVDGWGSRLMVRKGSGVVATAPERSIDGHRERLRRAFLANGDGAMGEADLLELLLCFAIPRQDVRQLAERLLRHFGSL